MMRIWHLGGKGTSVALADVTCAPFGWHDFLSVPKYTVRQDIYLYIRAVG